MGVIAGSCTETLHI